MFRSVVRSAVRRIAPLAMAATALATPLASSPTVNSAATLPIPHPLISEALFLTADATPPTQADCNSVNRRCFNPAAMANSYNYAVLHALGHQGQGKTIAVVDSFGSSTIRQDLASSRASTSSRSRVVLRRSRLRQAMARAWRPATSGILKSRSMSNGHTRPRRLPTSCW